MNKISEHITIEQKQALANLLKGSPELSLLSQLKMHHQKLQVKHIQANVNIFSKIKILFNVLLPLIEKISLNTNSAEYYATWVKKAKISQLNQMPDKNKLHLHLTAFIQHQFYLRQDYLIDIFLKSVQTLRNKAKKKRIDNEQSQHSRVTTPQQWGVVTRQDTA